MNLKFMGKKTKIVQEKIAKVKYLSFLYQIDQLFFAIYVKNNKLSYWPFPISKLYHARMANTKSAIKRIRRISRQTTVNKSRKSRFRNAIKKMNSIIEEKNKKDALAFLPKLNSELMKIAKTGIIKRQNASRNVSRITKKINSL